MIIDRSIDDRKWDTLIEEISSAVRESSGHNLGTLGLPSGPIRRRLKGGSFTQLNVTREGGSISDVGFSVTSNFELELELPLSLLGEGVQDLLLLVENLP